MLSCLSRTGNRMRIAKRGDMFMRGEMEKKNKGMRFPVPDCGRTDFSESGERIRGSARARAAFSGRN